MIYIGFLVVVIVRQPQPEPPEAAAEGERFEPEGSNGFAHGFVATCKNCGWSKPYETEAKSKQALGAHSRFCKGVRWRISPFSKPWK